MKQITKVPDKKTTGMSSPMKPPPPPSEREKGGGRKRRRVREGEMDRDKEKVEKFREYYA